MTYRSVPTTLKAFVLLKSFFIKTLFATPLRYDFMPLCDAPSISDFAYRRNSHPQIGDNIAFGDISRMKDQSLIERAADAGGSLEFIQKLPAGFDTSIESQNPTWSYMDNAAADGPLQKSLKDLQQELNVSGGQWQRLAISRTFMRALDNDNVRLMCYDEPSSALDPKAEFGMLFLAVSS